MIQNIYTNFILSKKQNKQKNNKQKQKNQQTKERLSYLFNYLSTPIFFFYVITEKTLYYLHYNRCKNRKYIRCNKCNKCNKTR
jgi:hypothetical protein